MEEIKIDCAYDEMVPVEKLVPHPRNNNQHPIEQLEQFAKYIKATKIWRHPIITKKKWLLHLGK